MKMKQKFLFQFTALVVALFFGANVASAQSLTTANTSAGIDKGGIISITNGNYVSPDVGMQIMFSAYQNLTLNSGSTSTQAEWNFEARKAYYFAVGNALKESNANGGTTADAIVGSLSVLNPFAAYVEPSVIVQDVQNLLSF